MFLIFLLFTLSLGFRDVWVLEDWVVDFMRPTKDVYGAHYELTNPAKRVSPFNIPDENRKHALLINGQYPGPLLNLTLGEEVEITIVNKLHSDAVSIHWHGLHQDKTPYMDGSRGVSQAGILPGSNFTYRFTAINPGEHYYHAHMDSVQASKGLKGPILIHDPEDLYRNDYDEDLLIMLSDEWRNPEVCLRLEGAMPGNDVCADIRWGSVNGQYGNGSKAYPFPIVEVEKGKCYRVHYIMFGANTENFVVDIKGHNQTLISLDGVPVQPLKVNAINMHLGERASTILCADQEPGNYLITLDYDYACSLTPGNFIPPGFSVVPSCLFYAYLKYKSEGDLAHDLKGTGGGQHPKPVDGVRFDLTNNEAWDLTRPVQFDPEPEEPDVRYVINMGLKGPAYKDVKSAPLTTGMWYMDLDGMTPRPWYVPTTPLMHTKGTCGVEDIPLINIPEDAVTVELVINNLSPTAHVLHMHGNYFKVINYMNYPWCNVNATACFVMPYYLNPCDKADVQVGDPDNPNIEFGGYWGCKYNDKKYKDLQNLATPLVKDSFQVWQRSWAVIRFKATVPGYWYFHCHMNQHVSLGMQMILNVLPSQQPPIPADIPTQGNCPIVNPETSTKKSSREEEMLQIIDSLKSERDELHFELLHAEG